MYDVVRGIELLAGAKQVASGGKQVAANRGCLFRCTQIGASALHIDSLTCAPRHAHTSFTDALDTGTNLLPSRYICGQATTSGRMQSGVSAVSVPLPLAIHPITRSSTEAS